MKNKNGFIATSLIYSFFLVFITLFLTIIADYLQNKVLLNTIENDIKDEINNSMGIQDFQIDDQISFMSGNYYIGGTLLSGYDESMNGKNYTITNITYKDKITNEGDSCIYLANVDDNTEIKSICLNGVRLKKVSDEVTGGITISGVAS